jgi:SPP1 family predicted phage head-tail adaptor
MLSAKDLACLDKDLADLYPSSVTLSRAATVSDGLGGETETWSSVGSLSARVSPISTQQAEEIVGSEIKDGMYYRVVFPRGTDVRLDDRVVFGTITLSIEAVMAPRSVEIERVVYGVKAAL